MLMYFICKAVDMAPQPIRCLWSGDNKHLFKKKKKKKKKYSKTFKSFFMNQTSFKKNTI